MFPFIIFLRRLGVALKKLTVGSISVALAVILYGTFSEYYLERGIPQSGIHSLFSSFWWTMQTLTTVGYGDTPIFGVPGRINAIFIMVVGIGSLGLFLASMSATITNMGIKRRIGVAGIRMRKHVIVCNYDNRGSDVVKEIMQTGTPVVAISDKDLANQDSGISYVKGSCLDDDVLNRAGIKNCDSAIILAGRSTGGSEDSMTDAMTIVMAMKIKSLNPNATVTAEILSPQSVGHAENAGVDECIVRGSLSIHLISRSIFFPGLSKALLDIISQSSDITVGEEDGSKYQGTKYGDLIKEFHSNGRFVIGLRKGKKLLKDLNDGSEVDTDGIIYIERGG